MQLKLGMSIGSSFALQVSLRSNTFVCKSIFFFSHYTRLEDALHKIYLKNVYFSVINEFCQSTVICIDGINGVGKSTITAQLNREYAKINLLYPEIVQKQDYNLYSLNSLEYIMSSMF